MAECECLPKCPFFNDRMLEKPVTTKMMKAQYCLGSNIECARHQVFKALGSENVPSDLYPSQRERSLLIYSYAAPPRNDFSPFLAPSGSN